MEHEFSLSDSSHLPNRQDARMYIKKMKDLDKKVAVVTGVFDILHSAHVRFIQQAKRQGDVLVVGLECDYRVKAFKGSHRPVNTISNRVSTIQSLKNVDFVFVIYGSPKLELKSFYTRLHKTINADVLVVSAHDPHLADRQEEIEFSGGTLAIVHTDKGVSTTAILRTFMSSDVLTPDVTFSSRLLYPQENKKSINDSWCQLELPLR